MSEIAMYAGQPSEGFIPGTIYSVNLMIDKGYIWVHCATHIKHYQTIFAFLQDWKFVDHD